MLNKRIVIVLLAVSAAAQDAGTQAQQLADQARILAEQSRADSGLLRSQDARRMLESEMHLMKESMRPMLRNAEAQMQLKMELDNGAMHSAAKQAQRLVEHQVELQIAQDKLQNMALFQPSPVPVAMPGMPALAPLPSKGFLFQNNRPATEEDRLYRNGKSGLEERDWDRAVEQFTRLIDRKSARSDAALYWKAYAQNRQGRRNEAQATLAEMMRTYPSSRWLDDAKALDVEIKQSSGQTVSPESEADEDLKVLALNGMIHSDPERAIPVLEGLLKKSTSPRLKERTVFVLAQTRSPKAREVLLRLAKGGVNPDLQYKAVEYLGYQSTPETRQALVELYASSSDVHLKRAVLRGFTASRDKERLVAAAKSEQNLDLRKEAIRGLGSASAEAELWQLFQSESTPEMKMEILRALPGRKENVDKLLEAYKSEKDATVQRELIRQVGFTRAPKASESLASLYPSVTDATHKRAIIEALRSSESVKPLVDIARAETDIKLKRYVVEMLSHMKSKEATDFLMEMLNK